MSSWSRSFTLACLIKSTVAVANPGSSAAAADSEPAGRRWYVSAEFELGALVTTQRDSGRRDLAGGLGVPVRLVVPRREIEVVYSFGLPMPVPGAAGYLALGAKRRLGNKSSRAGFHVGGNIRAQLSLGQPCRFGDKSNCPNGGESHDLSNLGLVLGPVGDLTFEYGGPMGPVEMQFGIHGLLGWMHGIGRDGADRMLSGVYFGGTTAFGLRF